MDSSLFAKFKFVFKLDNGIFSTLSRAAHNLKSISVEGSGGGTMVAKTHTVSTLTKDNYCDRCYSQDELTI